MSNNKELKRSLGLPLVTLYGLGNILGAGIYVLVGKVAGLAGTSTTLAFLLAMIIAGLTAFSYMELAGRFPVSASVSIYVYQAFKRRWLSIALGFAVIASGVASAAALSQGFAGYLESFIDVPIWLASTGLLLALGLIALKGIGESAKTAAVFTAIEVLGLALIIWYGKAAFGQVELGQLASVDPAVGVSGLIAGTFLAFYAFIGFEDMVNVAEEAKNPSKTMPLAILFALIASTVLYLLVVVVSTALVTPEELSQSDAPLTLVFSRSGASTAEVLSLIGVVAAINGVIVQIIMASRVLYGLSKQGWVNKKFAIVDPKRQTPTMATIFVVAVMIAGTLLLPLISLAQVTSLLVLSIFTLVNMSLIAIKRQSKKSHPGYITVPIMIPYIGVLLCAGTIAYQLLNWL
jgi:basic amino acid/polyamine antiporter, APA family